MAFKSYQIDDLTVVVYKRRGAKSLRLSVTSTGQIRVTVPSWAPYQSGVEFAKSRADWIRQQHTAPTSLKHGQAIGKAHHLLLLPRAVSKIVSRVTGTEIIVSFPTNVSAEDPTVQTVAKRACIRALRSQSEALLPQRLQIIAEKYGFSYSSISVKQLKSRWGSCDHKQNIVLNLFLMQLPWELIDYVLLHELVHTKVLKHGPEFWDAMEALQPNTKTLRKAIRAHQPVLA